MRTIKGKTVTWHDVLSPTDEDFELLKKSFKLDDEIVNDLKAPSSRQKMERREGFLYVAMRFPMYNHEKQTSSPVEIDFLVKPTELATVRYQPCEPVEEFFGNAQDLGGFQDRYFSGTSFTVFQSILQTLFTHGVRELAHIDKKIAEISDAVFAGKEKQMIKNISLVKRDILDFRRITKPMEGLLKVMEHELPHIFPEDRAPSMGVLLDDYENLKDVVGNLKDTVDSLESTNQTLLSAKIGEVMRMISLIAFVLAPVNIIAALFTMNAQFAPVIGQPYDWWIIIGMMGTGCAFLFLFFRAKKWF